MTSSIHVHCKKKKKNWFWIKVQNQELEHTLSSEKMVSIISSEHNKKPVWACIIMEQKVIYLLMVNKFTNVKQKTLRL